MACKECYDDKECTGWVSYDNVTIHLLKGFLRKKQQAGCVGLKRQRSPYDDYMKWGAVANLGGCTDEGVPCTNLWYSTPHAGQCADGARPT